MSNYLETRICEVRDADFQALITELCHCIDYPEATFADRKLSDLLIASITEGRKISKGHAGIERILSSKVDKWEDGTAIRDVCVELTARAKVQIDTFLGKTVLSLIKQCCNAWAAQFPRQKKETPRERERLFRKEITDRRRGNGSYI